MGRITYIHKNIGQEYKIERSDTKIIRIIFWDKGRILFGTNQDFFIWDKTQWGKRGINRFILCIPYLICIGIMEYF